MSVYVGRWDCAACGHKGIHGPETECPSCGADRPKDVVFYLVDEEANVVDNHEQYKAAKSGADWRCSYCGQNNPATAQLCISCGNPYSATENHLALREYKQGAVPTASKPAEQPLEQAPAPPKKQGKGGRVLLGIALVVAVLVFIFTRNKAIQVTIEGFQWERTIATEAHRLVEEEDWELPSQGTLKESFRAVHHYDQVLDRYETRTRTKQRAVGTEQYVCGKRDLGNGYFEDKYCERTVYEDYQEQYEEPIYRKEPVYRTKYRYTIFRWVDDTPLTAKGSDQKPTWPDTAPVEADSRRRAGARQETYTIQVRDEQGEQHDHEIPFKIWETLEKGGTLKAKRAAASGNYRGLDEPWVE